MAQHLRRQRKHFVEISAQPLGFRVKPFDQRRARCGIALNLIKQRLLPNQRRLLTEQGIEPHGRPGKVIGLKRAAEPIGLGYRNPPAHPPCYTKGALCLRRLAAGELPSGEQGHRIRFERGAVKRVPAIGCGIAAALPGQGLIAQRAKCSAGKWHRNLSCDGRVGAGYPVHPAHPGEPQQRKRAKQDRGGAQHHSCSAWLSY